MNSETETKVLPNNLSVRVVAKWLEGDQIKMRLELSNADNRESRIFDYSGGILAFMPKNEAIANRIRSLLNSRVNPKLKRCLEDEWNIQRGREMALQYAKPDPVGVLHSLIRDAECGDMAFEDFCAELGYNEDSRNDYGIWQACRETSRWLKPLLGTQFAEIQELVQDY